MGLSSKETESTERGKEGDGAQGRAWMLLPPSLGDPLSQRDGVGTAKVASGLSVVGFDCWSPEFRKAGMHQV